MVVKELLSVIKINRTWPFFYMTFFPSFSPKGSRLQAWGEGKEQQHHCRDAAWPRTGSLGSFTVITTNRAPIMLSTPSMCPKNLSCLPHRPCSNPRLNTTTLPLDPATRDITFPPLPWRARQKFRGNENASVMSTEDRCVRQHKESLPFVHQEGVN